MTENPQGKSKAYQEAGVDIDLATSLLKKVKGKISSTRRPEALAPIGGFGGLFQIDLTKWKTPVMVTSIDGVGTKLMIANMMNKHDTVGHDIVNHCINDIAVQGAEPVYFMDYIGIGKLTSPLYENVLEGIADVFIKRRCQFADADVVHEIDGFGALDGDVVDAVVDDVVPDGVMLVHHVCDHQLRADAVDAGDHHRFFPFGQINLEESAETANRRERLGAARR